VPVPLAAAGLPVTSAASPGRPDCALRVQSACTLLVALCAAYASYRHGREFALRFGADAVTAAIWPLMVDGLLTMATIELWRSGRASRAGARWPAWLAFIFGICVSLCANVAAAPELTVPAVTVAASPPVALLLAVELLSHALKHHDRAEIAGETSRRRTETAQTGDETGQAERPQAVSPGLTAAPTAEQRMRAYYLAEKAKGRTPTGAELERVAGTNNYGRRVLRHWRDDEHCTGRQSSVTTSAA
jgi:Protein of unknown function (DUF2637)